MAAWILQPMAISHSLEQHLDPRQTTAAMWDTILVGLSFAHALRLEAGLEMIHHATVSASY